jgi:hypothetical protein
VVVSRTRDILLKRKDGQLSVLKLGTDATTMDQKLKDYDVDAKDWNLGKDKDVMEVREKIKKVVLTARLLGVEAGFMTVFQRAKADSAEEKRLVQEQDALRKGKEVSLDQVHGGSRSFVFSSRCGFAVRGHGREGGQERLLRWSEAFMLSSLLVDISSWSGPLGPKCFVGFGTHPMVLGNKKVHVMIRNKVRKILG